MKPDSLLVKEKAIEKNIKQWDIVRCRHCGKEISMLTARFVSSGEYFVCKGCFHA